jgi:phosphate transport system substrate-binding protein
VAEGVKGAAGGIGYVEWSYATSNKLSIAKIDNGAGPVDLTADTVSAAVGTATQVGTGNDLSLKFDYATKAAGVYPIVLVTYEIVCSKGLSPEKTALVKDFLKFFVSTTEQSKLTAIQYAPLPTALQAKVATAIDAIS